MDFFSILDRNILLLTNYIYTFKYNIIQFRSLVKYYVFFDCRNAKKNILKMQENPTYFENQVFCLLYCKLTDAHLFMFLYIETV